MAILFAWVRRVSVGEVGEGEEVVGDLDGGEAVMEAYIEVPRLRMGGQHCGGGTLEHNRAYLTSPVLRWFMSTCMPSARIGSAVSNWV